MVQQTDPIRLQMMEARRNQILDAAGKVFAEKGYHRATIKDIAREAGIADGTMYTHFGGKDALVMGLMDRLSDNARRPAAFAAAADIDVAAFFQAYLRQRFEALDEGYDVMNAILPEVLADAGVRTAYRERIVEPMMAAAEQYFQSLIDRGQVRDLGAAALVRVMAATTMGLMVLRMLGDEHTRDAWGALPQVLAEVFLHGLTNEPPGR